MSETMVTGRCWAMSMAASTRPRATTRSAIASASLTMRSRMALSAFGVSGRSMIRRSVSWRRASLHSRPPFSASFMRGFIATPWPET